jgi:hypothetical protein
LEYGLGSSGDVLGDDETDDEHGSGDVERRSGSADDGADADGFAEDEGEEAGADESGDATQAVDSSLKLALFGGACFAGEKTLSGRPGEGRTG